MKRVIMIAYPFPPEGSATSYRTLRFVRQLSKIGWKTTVVSAVPSQYERYDPKLLAMVPSETEVIRVKGYDLWQAFQSWRFRLIHRKQSNNEGPSQARYDRQSTNLRWWAREMVRTAEAWWYHPDVAMPWIRPAVKAAMDMCAHQRPNVIWANAGRLSAFLIAQQVSQRTGVPYVLDFDDAWTIIPTDFDYRKPTWATRSIRRTMYRLLQEAQAVVFRYDTEAECFWRAYRGALDASKDLYHTKRLRIPNRGICSSDWREMHDFVCRHVARLSLRYPSQIPQLTERDGSRSDKTIAFLFVGEGMDALANEAAVLGLSDIIETAGPKPYAEIASLHREAHALLVLGRPATMRGYELFAGAKLFGYLKAGRPIVGVLPPDETKKVLHRVGARTVADVDSVPEITAVLCHVLDKWSTGTLSSLVPDRKACEAYSSEHQTATLVRALEGVPPEEPFIPGAQGIPPSLREGIEDKNWLDGSW